MRQLKGKRKLKSVYNRKACFLHIKSVFQKAYLKSQGTSQGRFEEALKACDDVFRSFANSEPNKNSFFILVKEDFKQYILNMANNEHLINESMKENLPKASELEVVGAK